MATTYSYTPVVAGNKIIVDDVNVPFATIFAALNSFDGGNIQSNSISGDALRAGTVAGSKLTDASVPGTKLQNATIAGTKLIAGTVDTTQIADYAIETSKLGTAAVTAIKLATGFGRIKVSTFTGDGAGTQAITGVGFQPIFLAVLSLGTGYLYIKTGDMAGGDAKNVTANNTASNVLVSLDADGFTVGLVASHMNVAGTTYYYLALGST